MDQIVILTIASVCLLTALLVGLAFYRMYLDAKKTREDIDQAIPATAKVLHVGASEASSDGIDIDLTIEVMPPFGAPYKVKATWSVEPVHVARIQEGSVLAIKIDKKNPRKIYSAEEGAEVVV